MLLLQLITVAAALRAKGPLEEEMLNLDDFAPLCDEVIVKETCRLLNEGGKHEKVEDFTTWQEIAEHLSSEGGDLDATMETLGYKAADGKERLECMSLCKRIVDFAKDAGVCPPKSDIACYTLAGKTSCDVDVRPSVLKTLGPKSDEDLPDPGDDELEAPNQGPVENPVLPLEDVVPLGNKTDSDDPLAAGIHYETWEAVERLANLFRFYPTLGAPNGLKEADSEGEALLQSGQSEERYFGHMTAQQARHHLLKEQLAKAYVRTVTRAFNARATERPLTLYFGRGAFNNPTTRKEVLRVLNSMSHVINNAYYFYPGPGCSKGGVLGYVSPKAYRCREHQMGQAGCTMTLDGKKFVIYLCPLYFQTEEEVGALVHEASHHATAYTDDVDYYGEKAYGRLTCEQMAEDEPEKALKNADSFSYYIQDVAEELFNS